MSGDLFRAEGGLARRLNEAEVLSATVAQLRKDLDLPGLIVPPLGATAFEALRADVLVQLEAWSLGNSAALSRAINRVDLTERMVDQATGRGGLHELAGAMVIRCLQKVLSRLRYAGRF